MGDLHNCEDVYAASTYQFSNRSGSGTQQQPATPQQRYSCTLTSLKPLLCYLERYQSDAQEVLLLAHHSIQLLLPSRAPAQTGLYHLT